jgi:hypothetical protein
MIRKSTDAGPAGIADLYRKPQHDSTSTPTAGESLVTRTIAKPRPVRPGVYDGTIVVAELASLQWRQTSNNPDGLVARLAVEIEDAGGVAHVFDAADATTTNLPRIEGIFNAAGLTLGSDDLVDRIGDLISRDVRITVKNIVPRAGLCAGREKAVIGSWIVSTNHDNP